MRHNSYFNTLFSLALLTASLTASAQSDQTSRKKSTEALYQLHSGAAMDSAFKVLVKKYPEQNNADYAFYDDVRTYIAMVFVNTNEVQSADKYMLQLKDSYGKSGRYFRLAGVFNSAHNNAMAKKYAKLSIDSALYLLKQEKHDTAAGLDPASALAAASVLIGHVLEEEKRYDEAIAYLSKTIPYCSPKNGVGLQIQEADLMAKASRHNEAMKIYLDLLKAGVGGEVMEGKIKNEYAATHNGSDAGFDVYLKDTKDKFQQAFTDSIRKSTFKEKAADFVLRDLNGKEVSLKDNLGRVVILDFWATWCGPCKASFPAMKGAIDKYAANKDVVFLFIDTWEYSDTPEEAIHKFLDSKDYNFTVLLDAKDKQTGQSEVVKKYGVDGIPAKFIIDKKGYIRYKLKGFNGDMETSIKELSDMIEIASKG